MAERDYYAADLCVDSSETVHIAMDEIREVIADIGADTGYVHIEIEETTEEQAKANRALYELVASRGEQ